MLAELLTSGVFAFVFLFLRVGTAVMVMPGFGENFVPVPVRLGVALAVTLALAPLLQPVVPGIPDEPVGLLLLVGGEIIIGLLIGGIARLIMSALHIAGTVISFHSGLAYALMLDPAQGVQGALIASFLSFLGIVVIFALDLHYLMLNAVLDSYVLFAPGVMPPVGDFTELATRVISGAFALGIQLAAPFILLAMIVNVGLGVLARLMPALPIFFIIIPMQIWFAFLLLGATLFGIMEFHSAFLETSMSQFLR